VIITPLVSALTIGFKRSAHGNKNIADAQTCGVGATLALLVDTQSPEILYAKSSDAFGYGFMAVTNENCS
jgi:hypothetical protein